MKAKHSILWLLLFWSFSLSLVGQAPKSEWVNHISNYGEIELSSITADDAGNSYVTGYFSGVLEINTTNGPQTFTTPDDNDDIIVIRLNPSGTVDWAVSFPCIGVDQSYDITIDLENNLYLTGLFTGSFDADPGIGTTILESNEGSADCLVIKMDTTGHLLWARHFGSISKDFGADLQITNENELLLTGSFKHTIDLDPGPDEVIYESNGEEDAFVLKLNVAGEYLWSKSFGGIERDEINDLVITPSGELILTGYFQDTVDFDPGIENYPLYSIGEEDIFLLNLTPEGTFNWAHKTGGTQEDQGQAVTTDTFGNIFLTGIFRGQADLEPGPDETIFNSAGNTDIFIQKFDPNGALVWTNQVGGPVKDRGMDIKISPSGNFYLLGIYRGTVDLDPGESEYLVTSSGGADAFIVHFDEEGKFIWAKTFLGPSVDFANQIYIDAQENIYTTGSFFESIVFEWGDEAFFLTSTQEKDAYVHKMAQSSILNSNLNIKKGVFELFPNPVQQNLFLKNPKQENITLKVLDLNGKILHNMVSDEALIEVSTEGFMSGIYFVSIETSTKLETILIVKT